MSAANHGAKLGQPLLVWLKRHWPYLAIFLMVAVIAYHHYDPDFGWHLRSGEIFFHDGVPKTDIYTYTASDFPWVNHEWLSDILVYLLHSAGGYNLLIIFYSLLWSLGFYLVSRSHRSRWPIFLAGWVMVPYMGVRTIAWTVFFLGLLYLITNSKKISKWWTVPLFLLWANMHGSFPLGLAYLAYMALKEKSWHWVRVGVASFAVTFCTAYGAHTYVEIIRTMLDPDLKFNVAEWRSLELAVSSIPYVGLWLAGLIMSGGKDWRKYLRFDLLLFIAALLSTRHAVPFVILSLPPVLAYVDSLPSLTVRRQDRKLFIITGALVVIGFGCIVWASRFLFLGHREAEYAPEAVRYVDSGGCSEGNIFNHYNIGGYLIWRVPSKKVYIDGRGPSWRMGDTHYMADYKKISQDKLFRERQFAKHNIRCVLWPAGADFVTELVDDGWRIVEAASGTYVFLEK